MDFNSGSRQAGARSSSGGRGRGGFDSGSQRGGGYRGRGAGPNFHQQQPDGGYRGANSHRGGWNDFGFDGRQASGYRGGRGGGGYDDRSRGGHQNQWDGHQSGAPRGNNEYRGSNYRGKNFDPNYQSRGGRGRGGQFDSQPQFDNYSRPPRQYQDFQDPGQQGGYRGRGNSNNYNSQYSSNFDLSFGNSSSRYPDQPSYQQQPLPFQQTHSGGGRHQTNDRGFNNYNQRSSNQFGHSDSQLPFGNSAPRGRQNSSDRQNSYQRPFAGSAPSRQQPHQSNNYSWGGSSR